MVGEADVTIRYAFLPTESSIKAGAEKAMKTFNDMASKQKWGSGIYSEAYHKRINKVMKDSVGKIDGEYKKTTSGVINLLRAFQQKTSLQTKLMALMKFAEGKGITGGAGGGEGGGIGGAVGGIAGGGMMAALGLIAALLVVIAVGMTLISAFFDAVGPIIKVVMKMISAMILILLMPFLKRGLPVLFDILKWMISGTKAISGFIDNFMTYIEKLLGKAMGGDIGAIFELLVGPLGMLVIFLGKELVKFLAAVDWKAIVDAVIPMLQNAFEIIKGLINTLGVTVFGEGIWNDIKAAIDFIATSVFGEGIWNDIKNAITGTGGVIDKFVAIRDAFGDFLTNLINLYNTMFAQFGLYIEHPQTGVSYSSSISRTPFPGGGSGGGIPEGYRRIPGGGLETIAERDARMSDQMSDFISRPGMGAQSFSPDDTIIGTKNPGALGGANITNNLYVSAGVDKKEFRKLLTEFGRQQGRELRTRTSYYGG